MWLLEWLAGRAYSVIDWFGDRYWQSRDLIASIPHRVAWLTNLIVGYYNAAVSVIQSRINDFYQTRISPLVNWINNLVGGLRVKLDALWLDFTHWIARLPQTLEGIRQGILQWAIARYDAWINGIQLITTNLVKSIIPSLQTALNSILEYRNWIEETAKRLTPEWLKDLIGFIGNTRQTVNTFVQNPVSFITGMLWGIFLDFLSFRLAYGLGTIKYSLPPVPNWGGRTMSDNIPIPAGTIGLVKPLARLYVSGYTFSASHRGLDFGAVRGEPVYASHDGTVVFAGWSNVGYGNYVDISGSVYWSRYAHLLGMTVSAGETVRAGQVIGYANNTGNSTGDHLHYELKLNGVYVNPALYL